MMMMMIITIIIIIIIIKAKISPSKHSRHRRGIVV